MSRKNILKLVLLPRVVPKTREQKRECLREGKKLQSRLLPGLSKAMEVYEGDYPEGYKKKFISEMKAYFIEAAEKLNEKSKYWEVNAFAFGNIFDQKENRFEEN